MRSTDGAVDGRLCVRPHEHSVMVGGREVPLTPREFAILRTLHSRPGWVFSAAQLAGESEESDYSPSSVSVLVSRLRRKLAGAGAPKVIETVRGFGYRLRASACEPVAADAEVVAASDNPLRDASWQLQEAVLEVEQSGTEAERSAAVDALEAARQAIEAELE